jgi:hypothetical protein
VGQTQTLTITDASTLVPGQMIYLDQAGGGTGQPGLLQLTAKNGNQLTLLNPTPPGVIPPADTTQPGLLKMLSGLVSDYVGGDNACHNLVGAIPPADNTKAGLLDQLSGNSTDYVAGDNDCYPLPLQVSANYAKLGGLLVQWGHQSPSGAVTSVTFPVAYSSAVPFVLVCGDGYYNSADLASTALIAYSVGRPTLTNFVVYPRYVTTGAAAVASQAFFWLAIGPA